MKIKSLYFKSAVIFYSFIIMISSFLPFVHEASAEMPEPEFVQYIGTQGTGEGQLQSPYGIAVNSKGEIFVSDAANSRIQKFDQSGNFLMQIPGLNRPYGLRIDSNDYLYVAESSGNTVRKFDSNGNQIGQAWGGSGTADGKFNFPMGIAIDKDNNVYVGDAYHNRVQKFDSNGNHLMTFGQSGTGDGQFSLVSGVAVDSKGFIYVADTNNNRIQKFSANGTFVKAWGSIGSEIGQFNLPYGLTIDSADNVYVGDFSNNRIQVFNSDGEFISMWSTAGTDGEQVLGPIEVGFYKSKIYVAEWMGNRISVFGVESIIQDSSNADLSNLTVSEGTLSPAFATETTKYSTSVANTVESIRVTPTVADEKATVTVNGQVVNSGEASEAISLELGKNTVTVEVTAQNGETQTYTIDVTRLKQVVTTKPIIDGETVRISDEDVNVLDQNGTAVVKIREGQTKVELTNTQLETFVQKNAKLKVENGEVELLIPAANFTTGEALTISLVKVDKDTDLAASAVYDFTIRLGNTIIDQFEQEIEIAFPVFNLGLEHPEELKVYYLNEETNKWQLVGGTYEDGYIKTTTNHFSTFALFNPNDFIEKEVPEDDQDSEDVEVPEDENDSVDAEVPTDDTVSEDVEDSTNDKVSEDENVSKETELPDTATSTYNWMMAGGILIFGSLIVIIATRRKVRS